MRKKVWLFSLFCIVSLTASFLNSEELSTPIDYQKEIKELDKSIQMLKRWQSQYLKKQKSYEAHNKRVLFRSESTSDGKRLQSLAHEAKSNALELQEQIDVLVARKEILQAHH